MNTVYDEEFDDKKPNNSQEEENRRLEQSADDDKRDSNMQFDTIFLKKYYRRIRHHIFVKKYFDQLNLLAAPHIYNFISAPTGYVDHVLGFVKPKYTLPKYKFDAVIEFILIDEGVLSALFSGLMRFLNFFLGLPVVKQIGLLIIKACRLAGIFNDTLMTLNAGINRFQNSQQIRKAKADYKHLHGTSKGMNKDDAVKSARTEAKVFRSDRKKDLAAHGYDVGSGLLSEGLRTAGTDGIKAAAIQSGKGMARTQINKADKQIANRRDSEYAERSPEKIKE